MKTDRAFLLAGRAAQIAESVSAAAHATANVMASGPQQAKVKERIAEAREVLAHYQDLVFTVYPAAMEHRENMTEAELRTWAARMVEALR